MGERKGDEKWFQFSGTFANLFVDKVEDISVLIRYERGIMRLAENSG